MKSDSVCNKLHKVVNLPEQTLSSSIEYEERVRALSKKFARHLISGSQGELPKSRNSKKKCQT